MSPRQIQAPYTFAIYMRRLNAPPWRLRQTDILAPGAIVGAALFSVSIAKPTAAL